MHDISHYVGNADLFPVLRRWDFYNHAGVSPLPHAAGEAIRQHVLAGELDAYIGVNWHDEIEALRALSARLINALPQEIAFTKNTSEGLSIVARGVDWRPGDRIITTNVEYPANIYPWMDAARAHGAEVVMVEEQSNADGARQVPLEKILEAAAHPRTRLVALSHVEFASGQRHDLAAIGTFCRASGKLFCVDAIQSLGIIPVDVQAMKIDYLSADGHKWLLGPLGAGIFYCRQELLARTPPLSVGWMSVVNAMDFGNYDYTLRADAGRFECGCHPFPGLIGLKASLELLLDVGIDAVGGRIKSLADRLAEGIQEKGYELVSPRQDTQWSGNIAFRSPVHDQEKIVQSLRKEHRIEIALREKRLRASPHFYNTETQIDRLIELLPGHER